MLDKLLVRPFARLRLSVSRCVTLLVMLPTLGVSGLAYGAGEPLEIELSEGVSYEKIRGAKSTYRDGVIEVVEFFWYGCPHCYELLAPLLEWEKNIPDDVRVEPLALAGSARWTMDARVYFAARALNLPEDFHRNFFLARHSGQGRTKLLKPENIADFFVEKYGKEKDFDRQAFLDTMDSFSVVGRTNAALSRAKSLGVNSVPELVVDGRFRINQRTAGSYTKMFEVADSLIELVRHEQSALKASKAKANKAKASKAKAKAKAKASKAKAKAKVDSQKADPKQGD